MLARLPVRLIPTVPSLLHLLLRMLHLLLWMLHLLLRMLHLLLRMLHLLLPLPLLQFCPLLHYRVSFRRTPEDCQWPTVP